MKILVVDDEKDMETLFQQRFRKEIREHSWNSFLQFQAKRPLFIYHNLTMKRY